MGIQLGMSGFWVHISGEALLVWVPCAIPKNPHGDKILVDNAFDGTKKGPEFMTLALLMEMLKRFFQIIHQRAQRSHRTSFVWVLGDVAKRLQALHNIGLEFVDYLNKRVEVVTASGFKNLSFYGIFIILLFTSNGRQEHK
jgi:hypothetical protein